jgi:hypothetical protein
MATAQRCATNARPVVSEAKAKAAVNVVKAVAKVVAKGANVVSAAKMNALLQS